MYSRLQYISQGATPDEHLRNIENVLKAGCRWVQLRYKNPDSGLLLEMSLKARKICKKYMSVLIINDRVDVALQSGADGVHLGLNDLPVSEARSILGPDKIIGGTANTLNDVMLHIGEGCDYIGLGPYRFTKTKEKLSPVLGKDGILEIMNCLPGITVPVYAVGGIGLYDIQDIIQTGVRGVAVSGALSGLNATRNEIEKFNRLLYAESYYRR